MFDLDVAIARWTADHFGVASRPELLRLGHPTIRSMIVLSRRLVRAHA